MNYSKSIELFYKPLELEISNNSLNIYGFDDNNEEYISYLNDLFNLKCLSNQEILFRSYSDNLNSECLRIELYKILYLIHNSFFEFKEDELLLNLDIIEFKLKKIISYFTLTLQSADSSNEFLISIIQEEMIVIQLLFFIISSMFQRYLSLKSIDIGIYEYKTFSSSLKKEQFIKDCFLLYIIQKSYPWLNLIINYIEKFFILIRKKEWNNLIITAQKNINVYKCEFYNFYIFTAIYGIVKKYYSINKNDIPIITQVINLEQLNELTIKLFHVSELDILYDYQSNKKSLFIDLDFYNETNFERVIIYNNYIIDNLTYVEFLNLNFGYDYHTLFLSSYDYLFDNIRNINLHLITKFKNLINILHKDKTSKKELKEGMINFYILDSFLQSLKNSIFYHMISCFNNDTLCDCYVKNEWLNEVINCYSIVYFLKFLIGAIISNYNFYDNNLIDKNNVIIPNILKSFFQLVCKDSIILPVKEIFFKERIIHDFVILFYYFVSVFKSEILIICDENLIENIREKMREFSEYENKLLFFLSNKILRLLKNDLNENYISPIRIITNPEQLICYNDIYQEIIKNKMPSEFNISNKENINILQDINNSNVNNDIISENHILTESKKKNFFNVFLKHYESYDITKFKMKFNFKTLRDLDSKFIIRNNNNKLILNIPLTKLNKSPFIFINENQGLKILSLENEDDLFHLMNNKSYTSKNILDKIYQSILYGENTFDEFKNVQNTMKYYDINFDMEYFEFCEKIKSFVL